MCWLLPHIMMVAQSQMFASTIALNASSCRSNRNFPGLLSLCMGASEMDYISPIQLILWEQIWQLAIKFGLYSQKNLTFDASTRGLHRYLGYLWFLCVHRTSAIRSGTASSIPGAWKVEGYPALEQWGGMCLWTVVHSANICVYIE